jgi:hypothetical protein
MVLLVKNALHRHILYNGEQAIAMDVSGVTIDHNAYLKAVFQQMPAIV